MKTKNLFFIICSILLPFMGGIGGGSCYAQNYQWATGGGTSTSMSISRDWEQTQYMCTDDQNNIYILSSVGDDNIKTDTFYMAHSHNTGSGTYPHLLFASYNCKGKLRWAKLLESATAAERYGIVYNKGSVYLHGGLRGNNKYIGNDTFINNQYLNDYVARFDTSGKYKWIKFIGPDSFNTAYRTGPLSGNNSIAFDGNGMIHLYDCIGNGIQITSTVRSTTGVYDIKYDTAGNLLGAVKMQLDTSAAVYMAFINKKSNNVYFLMGQVGSAPTLLPNYIACYDPTGNKIWSDTSGNIFCGIASINYDGTNSIYATAIGNTVPFIFKGDTIRNTYPSSNILVIFKIDTLGQLKWATPFYTPSTSSYFKGITHLPGNLVAATGLLAGKLRYGTDSIISTGDRVLMVIVDTGGSVHKVDQLTSSGFDNLGMSITSDKAGDIFIGGEVSSFITVDTSTFISTGGNTDFFVAKYGYSCHCDYTTVLKDSFTVSGANKHVPDTVHFTYAGSTGIDSMRWYFGDGKTDTAHNPIHIYTDTGTLHVCLTIYGCDSVKFCKDIKTLPPVAVRSVNSLAGVSVYPNPISGAFFVDGAEMGTAYRLFNIMGQLMMEGIITEKRQQINTGNLRLGSYLLELTDKQGNSMRVSLTKE